MPWGSNYTQTISILWPTKSQIFSPVKASQILAFLSKDPVTTLSLKNQNPGQQLSRYFVLYLPVRFVESHGVDDVGMFVEVEQLLSCQGVPDLAGSIVRASNELVSFFVEGTVGQGKEMGSEGLEEFESLVFVLGLFMDETFDDLLQLGLARLRDKRLLEKNLVYQSVYVGTISNKELLAN